MSDILPTQELYESPELYEAYMQELTAEDGSITGYAQNNAVGYGDFGPM